MKQLWLFSVNLGACSKPPPVLSPSSVSADFIWAYLSKWLCRYKQSWCWTSSDYQPHTILAYLSHCFKKKKRELRCVLLYWIHSDLAFKESEENENWMQLENHCVPSLRESWSIFTHIVSLGFLSRVTLGILLFVSCTNPPFFLKFYVALFLTFSFSRSFRCKDFGRILTTRAYRLQRTRKPSSFKGSFWVEKLFV